MTTATPQPPAGNKVQVLFARDAEGVHAPVLAVVEGQYVHAAKLTSDEAEKIGMTLMELAAECRQANESLDKPTDGA